MQTGLHSELPALRHPQEVRALSDESLMTLLQAGDASALHTLFRRYSRLVYGIALSILRDPGEAEDVVQESFLYVFRKALAFQPARGTARVWIVEVAYSRARDQKDSLLRRGHYARADTESPELADKLQKHGDLESEIGAKLDLMRLQQAFNNLSHLQREALNLYYFEGLGMREISETMNQSLGNVRHHFYRGLERLRRGAFPERFKMHPPGRNSRLPELPVDLKN
jgi:RNA polymerase sigma-70 factor (ECF subfamily)